MPLIVPAESLRNFTPSSTAAESDAEAVPGVAVSGQMLDSPARRLSVCSAGSTPSSALPYGAPHATTMGARRRRDARQRGIEFAVRIMKRLREREAVLWNRARVSDHLAEEFSFVFGATRTESGTCRSGGIADELIRRRWFRTTGDGGRRRTVQSLR